MACNQSRRHNDSIPISFKHTSASNDDDDDDEAEEVNEGDDGERKGRRERENEFYGSVFGTPGHRNLPSIDMIRSVFYLLICRFVEP
jgi:hypothetical protein